MESKTFDLAIVGMGVAGSFATYRLAKEHRNLKVLCMDTGQPPAKRRLQMQGFLGLLPNSDGKLFLNDLQSVSSIIGTRKTSSTFKLFSSIMTNICPMKTTKDRSPSAPLNKRLKKAGFNIQLNNHIQLFPKDIHTLSKFLSAEMELASKNLTFSFNNEAFNIDFQKGMFVIEAENGEELHAKKLLLCIGRAGWRWAGELFSKFGLITDNKTARYGVRIEMPSDNLREFNRSSLTIRNDRLEVGPFAWGGTVIPEDHVDMAISAFRSNEDRWKTDKVSFPFICSIDTDNQGFQQTDRIGQLSFILANDRVSKERISALLNNKSTISNIKEYQVIANEVRKFGEVVPEILSKAYFHVPTIIPLAPKIKVNRDLSTEMEGLYVAGESAGVIGVLSAALTGLLAAKEL